MLQELLKRMQRITETQFTHPSMVSGDDDTNTQIVPTPELHLLTGPVNNLYEALSKVWNESVTWLSFCNKKKTEYQGASFTGNDSRKLLKSQMSFTKHVQKNSRIMLTPSTCPMKW